jgi:hypothetical protein
VHGSRPSEPTEWDAEEEINTSHPFIESSVKFEERGGATAGGRNKEEDKRCKRCKEKESERESRHGEADDVREEGEQNRLAESAALERAA